MIKKITLLNFQTFNTDILSYDTPLHKKNSEFEQIRLAFLAEVGGATAPPCPPLGYATAWHQTSRLHLDPVQISDIDIEFCSVATNLDFVFDTRLAMHDQAVLG